MSILHMHLTILLVTAVAIFYADHLGFRYISKKNITLNRSHVMILHYIVFAGLIGMIATGIKMAQGSFDYFLTQPAFVLKMGFVVALIVNSFVIGKLQEIACTAPFEVLDQKTRLKLLTSGAVSGVSWLGATIIGYFFI